MRLAKDAGLRVLLRDWDEGLVVEGVFDVDTAEIAINRTAGAAVQAAGLVETLQGDSPFTIFAPTNAAFGALPDGTVETLPKPENKGMLTKVRTFHVIDAILTPKM